MHQVALVGVSVGLSVGASVYTLIYEFINRCVGEYANTLIGVCG